MAYWEEKLEKACPGCGLTYHLIAFLAGDSRANEWEIANCFSCGVQVASEKCAILLAAETPEQALAKLRNAQGQG